MSATATVQAIETVADLLEQLGGIPPERIRIRPRFGTATERDVIEIHDRENRLCELIDGVLVEKAMGFYESRLAALMIRLLEQFAEEHRLGIVAGADGMMRLAPGLVRIPDVSFLSWESLPDGKVPREPIPDLVPDLAVEILSRSNTPGEMARKLRDYFAAGVRLVWVMDPNLRSVSVYRSHEDHVVVREQEALDGADVLPGFTLLLREFFQRAEPTPPSGSRP